jgi:hypothetical protein
VEFAFMGTVAKWHIIGQTASAKRKCLFGYKFISFRINQLHIASDTIGAVIVHFNLHFGHERIPPFLTASCLSMYNKSKNEKEKEHHTT